MYEPAQEWYEEPQAGARGRPAIAPAPAAEAAVRAQPGAFPPVRALLVCSAGGHLAQMCRLRPWWEKQDRLWVTFDRPDARSRLAGERVTWAYHPTTRNIPNMFRNLLLAFRVFQRYRPDLIVSNGAGVAFPFFVAARLLGIKTVYLEVYDRIDTPSLTGRLCHPLSNLFLLQWEEQRRMYPRGEVIGTLF